MPKVNHSPHLNALVPHGRILSHQCKYSAAAQCPLRRRYDSCSIGPTLFVHALAVDGAPFSLTIVKASGRLAINCYGFARLLRSGEKAAV
jgi:hypothetical protein